MLVGWRAARVGDHRPAAGRLDMSLWNRGRLGQPVGGVIHHGGLLSSTASLDPAPVEGTSFESLGAPWGGSTGSSTLTVTCSTSGNSVEECVCRWP